MTERETKLTEAFIVQKFKIMRNQENMTISKMVERTMVHLWQLGIWEEAKNILKNYILEYLGFFEDAEFINGEVRRKRS